jgi:nucleotide-binding universal stress UspA family protein
MSYPYKQILCPVDFDECSSEALREAGALALDRGCTVHVLHTVHINPLVDQGAAEGFSAQEMYETQIEDARRKVEQMLTALPPEVKREVMVEIGEPGDVILNVEKRIDADLIVMATHGRRGLKHLVLGSIAERVVRDSPVPVLTVRQSSSRRSS